MASTRVLILRFNGGPSPFHRTDGREKGRIYRTFPLAYGCFLHIEGRQGDACGQAACVGCVPFHGDGLFFAGHEVEIVVAIGDGEHLFSILCLQAEPYHEGRGAGRILDVEGEVAGGHIAGCFQGHLGKLQQLLPAAIGCGTHVGVFGKQRALIALAQFQPYHIYARAILRELHLLADGGGVLVAAEFP